jgi:hypothetical protein
MINYWNIYFYKRLLKVLKMVGLIDKAKKVFGDVQAWGEHHVQIKKFERVVNKIDNELDTVLVSRNVPMNSRLAGRALAETSYDDQHTATTVEELSGRMCCLGHTALQRDFLSGVIDASRDLPLTSQKAQVALLDSAFINSAGGRHVDAIRLVDSALRGVDRNDPRAINPDPVVEKRAKNVVGSMATGIAYSGLDNVNLSTRGKVFDAVAAPTIVNRHKDLMWLLKTCEYYPSAQQTVIEKAKEIQSKFYYAKGNYETVSQLRQELKATVGFVRRPASAPEAA